MFKHIIVPLDGSSLAENACAVAISLARLFSAEVTLLHLLEANPPANIHGERHLAERVEAEEYLKDLCRRLDIEDLQLHCHVHEEAVTDVARGIVAHEQEVAPDLIVMSSHGPKRFEHLIRGSLPQQVVSFGKTPLLLVSAATTPDRPLALRRLLVPLDGQTQHERTFAIAKDLALATSGTLFLLSVVVRPSELWGPRATVSRYLPGSTWALQQQAMESQQHYLEQRLAELKQLGLAAGAEIAYGKVAPTIARTARKTEADLIIMATHGKFGSEAFWANSIAAQVQGKTSKAILLVPL